ncbi:MAG: acylphosphatase, partial [Clostridia bacterium]|nr:acylphosphatase [Clostridia bacterium]
MADTNTNNGAVRRALRFTGSVQGVGFRWRAVQAANAVGATGWVRNDP